MNNITKHVDLDTLSNVITAIPSNIFLKDRDLNYVFSSHIWEQVDSGDDEEFDIYGKSDRDIRKDTDNLDNVEKTDRQIMETGIGTRYTIKTELDGHLQYLELVKEPVRDNDGNVIGIVGLINDVTSVTKEISDRLENEKAYREAMKAGAKISYSVNLTKDMLEEDIADEVDGEKVKHLKAMGIKAPCCFSEMNEKFVEIMLTGDCKKEYLEFHDPKRLIEMYNSGQRAVVQEMRLELNGMNGSVVEVWFYITILLMRNTKDEITAFVTVNDTTEARKKEEEVRHQLEENVKEAERVANMKSDFLANMSHEIRTPMNAVVGMAEIALREDLPDAARDALNQIKSSGAALLNIINDILDFSKIESGKMDIIPDNFDPLSVIHDISGVVMNRIGEKEIELIGTINPNLPIGLYADVLRLRQILINLANNSVKFTQKGFVQIDVDFDKLDDDEIMLKLAVIDTGIGIKEEDLDKLFVSFQQVDSKRNRNIEGTGLGLAICAKLVALMGGTINVASEYEKGSAFSFAIPVKITDWTPALNTKDNDKKLIIGYWDKTPEHDLVFQVFDELGIENYKYEDMAQMKELHKDSFQNKTIYFVTSYQLYAEELDAYIDEHPETQFIVVCDMFMKETDERSNVFFIKKPISTVGISMALNRELFHVLEDEAMEFDFVAPDAKVLIVDDNEVNLAVSEGLLEPLKMQVKTALSGKIALELLEKEHFDLVFMDHMMPELDGVETTRIIRRLHPELNEMPIIALSANAVENARTMFLSEGMNDFVAKPIGISIMINKIRQWLPAGLIKKTFESGSKQNYEESEKEETIKTEKTKEEPLVIGDLDIEAALKMIGSQKIFMTVLETYAKTIKTKAELIKTSKESGDIAAYTTAVHALKSSSKQIGAMELSSMAAELEACGHGKDVDTIHEKTDALLERYLGYYHVLSPVFGLDDSKETESDKPSISKEKLVEFFENILTALEELDMDTMETISAELNQYSHEGEAAKYNQSLKDAVTNYDMDAIAEIVTSWKNIL